jgi:hypothetical protein
MALAVLIGIRIVDDWPLADNHIYLLAYWCLAAAAALRTADPPTTLALSCQWLVGLAFALAVLWKAALSPDYLDGRFFRVTILTDPRFAEVATLTGLSNEQLEANRTALEPMPEGAELLAPPEVTEPSRLRTLARTATWSVLALEVCVALGFLTSIGSRPYWLRHAFLLVFCLTTYAFAPVAGFGWLLLVLGLSQCADDWRGLRHTYVFAFVIVLLYSEVPWPSLVSDWIGRG